MNREEFEEKLRGLNSQLDEMNGKLDDAREQRNGLLRERFDLKEQRRYLRGQLREAKEAGNTDRAERLEARLDELQQQLDGIDAHIEEIETVIESTNDSVDAMQDSIEEARSELEDQQEAKAAAEPEDVTGEAVSDKWEKAMEGFNTMLQKGLQKLADTLENVDFETLGQDVSSAVNKAAKTVGNAATEAARGVENVWNEAKDNRQKPGGIGDYRISGSGVLDGGCYNRISCTGSCKVSSDIVCREITTSGSFRACGNVDCSGEIRSSGSFHCDGNVEAGAFSGSGSTRIMGNMKTGLLNIPGSMRVGGGVSAGELRVSGSLKAGGDCEADTFTASGSLSIGGMINAETVKIKLSRSQSTVGSIGGAQVTVEQSATAGLLSSILAPGYGTLACDSIEGDQIDITGVKADMVRGAKVMIRSGCVIEKVEYSETCSIDGDAQVKECVKI